jgi:transcriptional regulator with XRE-family HTH domain
MKKATAVPHIRALRLRHSLSRADLAARSGVSERQIARIETGKSVPQANTLARIAAALNTDGAALLVGLDNDAIAALLSDAVCRTCGAGLSERTRVSVDDTDVDFDLFECGSSRGWRERPCPQDPAYPAFSDFELIYFDDDRGWSCLPHGRTAAARSLDLPAGYGPTKEAAARQVEKWYVWTRLGPAEAEHRFSDERAG